jgi:DNA polymerase-3 subunit epsilon
MQLQLDRPLAFIDLETTGINVATDRIVEISIVKIFPDGTEKVYTRRVNPGIPIPAHTTFDQLAIEILEWLDETDLAGYNSNRFDIPLLIEEFLRNGFDFNARKRRMIDVQTIFHKMEQRTLAAAYKYYCGKELEGAHSAEVDSRATYEILKAQVERYEEIQNNPDFLAKFSNHHPDHIDFAGRLAFNKEGIEIFNFGKFKGRTVEDVLKENPGYFNWIMNNDFPAYTKKMLKEIKVKLDQK